MSDYLWDKSGERDAEVERLEELLGELRHSPRALELPPDVEFDAARAPRSFRKAWPAVAAALLLALMAGAFVASRFEKIGGNGQTASQDSQNAPRQIAPPQGATPHLAASPDAKSAPPAVIRDLEVVKQVPSQKVEPPRVRERIVALKSEREFIPTANNKVKEREGIVIRALGGDSQGVSAAEMAARQQLAKEQLVYALHLTSFKLKEVRKKTRGIVDSKSAFDERNP